MAYEAWVTIDTHRCEKLNSDASLLERRIYPADQMPDFPGYQVRARKCSLGIVCNLAGIPCEWAYSTLGADPFQPTV
jgi:hypothetical protein